MWLWNIISDPQENDTGRNCLSAVFKTEYYLGLREWKWKGDQERCAVRTSTWLQWLRLTNVSRIIKYSTKKCTVHVARMTEQSAYKISVRKPKLKTKPLAELKLDMSKYWKGFLILRMWGFDMKTKPTNEY
jgi:hypothetical protein